MHNDSHSPGDPILSKYLDRLGAIGLPSEMKEQVLEVFKDYSRAVHSNPLDYKLDKDISDQIKTLFENYRLIASNLPDLFFILDTDLKFTFIAPSVEYLLEYTYQELIGESFDTLVPKWLDNNLSTKMKGLELEKPDAKNPQKFTIQLSSKYGKLNWYEVQITVILDNKENLKGYNGVCRDISERLKYEEALRRAKTRAEESDRLKSAFLANMSHEIRTPLNGIIGFSTMLNNKRLPEEKRDKYSGYIISSSHQLLTIINDIIDISKIEARQLSFLNRKMDLHGVFQEVAEIGEIEVERLEKKNITIKIEYGQKESMQLNIDEIRLKQVLFNLMVNALKYTNKGQVTLGYKVVAKDIIRFYVKDTGDGIPQNIQNSIFDRFRRGEVNSQSKISGTGLGLAISKGIVELFGGQIGVASEKKQGSEFFFTLPLNKYLIEE